MKLHNLFFPVLIIALCLSFAACLGKNEGSDTAVDPAVSSDKASVSDTEKEKLSISIGGVDISSYSILLSGEEDGTASAISEYIVSGVKSLTGLDIPVVNDSSEALDNKIIIGNTARIEATELGEDEFIIKCEDGKMYIWYPEGASAYQGVTAILSDALINESIAIDGKITLAADFEFSGLCSDYIIGDNEFNPFE